VPVSTPGWLADARALPFLVERTILAWSRARVPRVVKEIAHGAADASDEKADEADRKARARTIRLAASHMKACSLAQEVQS
jgi:hypothetical protein